MSVNSEWIDFIQNTIGCQHLFQLNEADTAFVDVIGSLSITLTSGVTTEQSSGLVGNTTDKSILGTATVNTTRSASLTLGGTNLNGPWSVGCLYKHSGAPASDLSLWTLGDATVARSSCTLLVDATNLVVRIEGAGAANLVAHATSGINDGNWHLIIVRYNNSADRTFMWSVDGSAFDDTGQSIFSLSGAPVVRGMDVLCDVNAARDGNGVGLDELFTKNVYITDSEAADIYDKALVSGFPSGGMRNRWNRGVHHRGLVRF